MKADFRAAHWISVSAGARAAFSAVAAKHAFGPLRTSRSEPREFSCVKRDALQKRRTFAERVWWWWWKIDLDKILCKHDKTAHVRHELHDPRSQRV